MEYVSTTNAPGAIGPYSQAVKAKGMLLQAVRLLLILQQILLKPNPLKSRPFRFAKILKQYAKQQAPALTR